MIFKKKWFLIGLISILAACEQDSNKASSQVSQYIKSAELMAKQGELRAATVQAKNAIQIEPENSAGYLQLAKVYNQIGYYAEVEKLLAPKLDAMPEVRYELAESYFYRKKYKSSLETLDHPQVKETQEVRLVRALSNLALGDNKGFDLQLHNIESASSTDGYWRFVQAKKAEQSGDLNEAESAYSKIPSSSPIYLESLVSAGELLIRLGRYNEAEKKLTEALHLITNADSLTVLKARVLSTLVEMLVGQGRSGEAYTYQRILASANPQLDFMKSRFDEALEFYAEGNTERAKTLLHDLHESFPNNSNVTTLLGMIAFQEGRDTDAEKYFSEIIDPETVSPGVIHASSLLKVRNNRVDEAVEQLAKAVAAQPRNAQLLTTYGMALLQRDASDKQAVLALEKSLAMDPTQQRIRLVLAERHFVLKENELGLAQLESAFQKQPLDPFIHQAYFNQLFKYKGEKAVATEIAKLKKDYTDNTNVSLLEAYWLIEAGKLIEAEKLLIKLTADLPTAEKLNAYLLLSGLYVKQSKFDTAQKTLESYIEIESGVDEVYNRWLSLITDDELTASKQFLLKVQEINNSAWQPYFYQALLDARSQRWEDADIALQATLKRTAQSRIKQKAIAIYNNYGFQQFKAGNTAAAQSTFLKTLAVDPLDKTALYFSVSVALQNDQIEQAKRIVQQSSQGINKEPVHFFLEGLIFEKENNNQKALEQFRAAWEKEAFDLYAEKLYSIYVNTDKTLLPGFITDWNRRLPKSTQALLLTAMLKQEQGLTIEAISSYEDLLKITPQNVVALNNLAWLYMEQDLEKAELLAASAAKLAPESADVLDTYAWILFKNKKTNQALSVAKDAIKLAPDNVTIREHLDAIQHAAN